MEIEEKTYLYLKEKLIKLDELLISERELEEIMKKEDTVQFELKLNIIENFMRTIDQLDEDMELAFIKFSEKNEGIITNLKTMLHNHPESFKSLYDQITKKLAEIEKIHKGIIKKMEE